MLKEFWWGDLRKKDNLDGIGIYGKIILKWVFRKWNGGAWAVMFWLRIGADGRILCAHFTHFLKKKCITHEH